MDVRHLELLRDLAERGSVTAVAQATHRTPSAVSQQLKVAQRELGAILVEPAGRGLRLTEAGRLLANGAVEVATAIEQVQAEWDDYLGGAKGSVGLAVLPSAATFLLPGVLRDLAGERIVLRCHDVDIAEAEFARLVADYDIVVAHSLTRRAPTGAEGLDVVRLVREPLDVALPVGHPLAVKSRLRAEDLVDEVWIGVPPGFPFDTVLQAIEGRTNRRLQVAQRLKDNHLIEALVAVGHGLAILPRFTTRPGAGVVLRPLEGIQSGRYVFAIMRQDRARRLAVRRVLDALVRVARSTEKDSLTRPDPTRPDST